MGKPGLPASWIHSLHGDFPDSSLAMVVSPAPRLRNVTTMLAGDGRQKNQSLIIPSDGVGLLCLFDSRPTLGIG